MAVDWVLPRQVITGVSSLQQLPEVVRGWGGRAYLVTGRDTTRAARVVDLLRSCAVEVVIGRVVREPTIEDVERVRMLAADFEAQFVVAVGGGSVLDVGKAVAGLLANPGHVMEYLEVVGEGKPFLRPALPFLAIPTTAGTGSEATRNAVLGVPHKGVKVSMRNPHLVPRAAILDPELTVTLPREVTITSGLDALTQLLEAFVCRRANALTDAVCREGLRRAVMALPLAVDEPANLSARMDMMMAAFFSGVALANAGLGAVHGFAGPLGGLLEAPHGALCAALLPAVVKVNVKALRERDPASPALNRYAEIATLVTGRGDASAEDLAAWLHDFAQTLQVPTLHDWGMTSDLIPSLIESARKASSMKANPVELTDDELAAIIDLAL